MPIVTAPPLSLYIHIPWCVRKCPYCDFNSHAAKAALPEALYTAALLDSLERWQPACQDRPLVSIFFGGGTPSLFSAESIANILSGVAARLPFAPEIEITLEANPGTIDQERFDGLRAAGINRLSLGIQSLENEKLKSLGRIHDRDNAIRAIHLAKQAGFENVNVDLMYGLPDQTLAQALLDLETALSFEPQHVSWYQLTLEPNTLFYHQRPPVPADDLLWDMQLAGQEMLASYGYRQYEVSAYARKQECLHNRNYWEYGDYLGIGAGAHSKLTNVNTQEVLRFAQAKHPRDYLEREKREQLTVKTLTQPDLVFEFMLNALRLTDGVSMQSFSARTGVELCEIANRLALARKRGLLIDSQTQLCASEQGKRFLNDLVALFL